MLRVHPFAARWQYKTEYCTTTRSLAGHQLTAMRLHAVTHQVQDDLPDLHRYTEVTDDDRNFVLENINKRLKLTKPLTREDIIAERCVVQPLVVQRQGNGEGERDWMQLSRKHEIDVDQDDAHLSIYGGKLTCY